MAYYITRDLDTTATGKTQLTSQGADSSQGSITVPTDVKAITKVIIAAAALLKDGTFTVVLVRLTGTGIPGGEQVITGPAVTSALTSSGAANNQPSPFPIPVNIPVKGGNVVTVTADMTAGAFGSSAKVHVSVTLEFT